MIKPAKTIAIVQARMGSARFPGKMMELINGIPVVEWVLRRTAMCRDIDEVILATSNLPVDDSLASFASGIGFTVYRGDEENVLSRFVAITKQCDAKTVVRVCGDRPLVDPGVLSGVIYFFKQFSSDLAFNHISDGLEMWPRGFGAEVLSGERMLWLNQQQLIPEDKEHVTFYMWRNREKFNISPVPCFESYRLGVPDVLFDLDWPQDLDKIRRLCSGLDLSVSGEVILKRWQREHRQKRGE